MNANILYKNALSTLLKAKDKKVLCAFSGGVDSLVAATLATKILGRDNVYCIFVDHGLVRPQDIRHIQVLNTQTNLNIKILDASKTFLKNLRGITNPEQKRKIIGRTFIEQFDKEVKKIEKSKKIKFDYLLQGTIYPDIIESKHKSTKGYITIKSHHNVGGLPKKMNLQLLEPLATFFKNEVRVLGKFIKLKNEWLNRHPFPGPGLGVRIVGDITLEKIKILQQADEILLQEMTRFKIYQKIWQAFFVFLPIKTVGIKNNNRVYEYVLSLRLINSSNAMTASCYKASYQFLQKISSRITNEITGITRVLYDLTNKPPATIEWE